MKPISMDPGSVRPRADTETMPCTTCHRSTARWYVLKSRDPDLWLSMCARCWLYESDWGKGQADEIASLVAAVETRMGKPFQHGEDGKLTHVDDADRILSSIAVTARIFHVADRKAAGQ